MLSNCHSISLHTLISRTLIVKYEHSDAIQMFNVFECYIG